MKRIYLLFSLLIGCIYLHAAIYNVMDFGAKADGKTIASPAKVPDLSPAEAKLPVAYAMYWDIIWKQSAPPPCCG